MLFTRLFVTWFENYDSQESLGSKLRKKRIAPLLDMIEIVFNQYGYVNIIDIGGTERYWNIVPEAFLANHQVTITVVNLPKMTLKQDYGPFKFIGADACNLEQFGDQSFHIAHSNSVVEHVGDWKRMVQFAEELARVAQQYFVQTPNYWFPIEPHFMAPFFHWLPKQNRIWLVLHFHLGNRAKAASMDEAVRLVDSVQLLDRRRFQELFKDAQVLTERFFLLPKSLIAVKKVNA